MLQYELASGHSMREFSDHILLLACAMPRVAIICSFLKDVVVLPNNGELIIPGLSGSSLPVGYCNMLALRIEFL